MGTRVRRAGPCRSSAVIASAPTWTSTPGTTLCRRLAVIRTSRRLTDPPGGPVLRRRAGWPAMHRHPRCAPAATLAAAYGDLDARGSGPAPPLRGDRRPSHERSRRHRRPGGQRAHAHPDPAHRSAHATPLWAEGIRLHQHGPMRRSGTSRSRPRSRSPRHGDQNRIHAASAGRTGPPGARCGKACRSWRRPRWMRLRTVPSLIPRVAAISS